MNLIERFLGNVTVTITEQRFQEVADHINDSYGSKFTKKQIMDSNLPMNLLFEIANDGYSDTDQREQIADFLAIKYIGVGWPCYGDSKKTQKEFTKKAKAKGLL